MRILSIDYGKKRTGIAVTDPLQIIANGLVTVATPELFAFVEQYIQKEQVERIVIGKPTQPNGQPSENLARVENFFNRWRKAHPEVPIEYYDERFTSVLAHRAMIEGGVKKNLSALARRYGTGDYAVEHYIDSGVMAELGQGQREYLRREFRHIARGLVSVRFVLRELFVRYPAVLERRVYAAVAVFYRETEHLLSHAEDNLLSPSVAHRDKEVDKSEGREPSELL